MVAPLPGRERSRLSFVTVLVAHVSGLAISAVLVGAGLYAIGHHLWALPQWACAVVAFSMAVFAAGVLPIQLRGSGLRIPRSWFQLGDVLYSAAFGLGLGSGVLLSLSSPGYYLVLAWGLSGTAWSEIWPVFAAFAVGRAIVWAINVGVSRRPAGDPLASINRTLTIIGRLNWFECTALACTGVLLLLAH